MRPRTLATTDSKARPVKPLEQELTFNKMLYKSGVAVANHGGAMEADTISKNGRNLKSHMSREIFKIKQSFLIVFTFVASAFIFSSCPEDKVSKPTSPFSVEATQSGSYIIVTWRAVEGATSYNIYRSNLGPSVQAHWNYPLLGSVSVTTYIDFSPFTGDNYYAVSAVNSAGESSRSIDALNKHHVNYTSGGGGGGGGTGGGTNCASYQNTYNDIKRKRDDTQRLYDQSTGTSAIAYANQISNYNAMLAQIQQTARNNGCTLIL